MPNTTTPITIQERLAEVQSRLKAPKNQFNNFGKYNYRKAEDILQAAKPILKEFELTLTINDDIMLVGERYYVKATATIIDPQGQIISTSAYAREQLAKSGMDESQITGSASTYARKYALNGLFAIDNTDDADVTNKHESGAQALLREANAELTAASTANEVRSIYKKYSVVIAEIRERTHPFFIACKEKAESLSQQLPL